MFRLGMDRTTTVITRHKNMEVGVYLSVNVVAVIDAL